jgi:hypothetical protein
MAVTVNKTRFKLPSQLALTTEPIMRDIGLAVREAILARTAEGKDSDGVPFTPYSEAYSKRKAYELHTSDVNLQVSGDMLTNLTIKRATDKSVTLGWSR